MISKQVVLPKLAVNTVWQWAEIGKPHPILGTADVWVADEHEERFAQAVLDSLRDQDMLTGGHPAPELTATLRLIASATDEVYGWFNARAASSYGAAIVAAKDGKAVRVARDNEFAWLSPASVDDLVDQFVQMLVPTEPADIEPFHVPRSKFDAATPPEYTDDGFEFSWQEDQPEGDPASKLTELLHARRVAAHQVYAAKRPAGGKRRRCGPYSVIDIANKGRIITFASGSTPETEYIRCLPGDRTTLIKELSSAHAALA